MAKRGKEKGGWVGERKLGKGKRERERGIEIGREIFSRTDDFYFGPVVNSAWLSDKSTAQWLHVHVSASDWRWVSTWGEKLPYLEKGSTL